MTAVEDVKYVFEKALALMDEREEMYGDAWKRNGKGICIPEVFRKANYIRVQWEKNLCSTDKFLEDILDLINYAAFSYHLVSEETEEVKKE
ncbi:hypothetical protein LCGC14_2184290 [marine sediment metagenome]|uniref:Nucleotide modification associated domain-containing protein n=1 Tax=marine sediment metagenome TaxID=412755 RepID=A0A0F9E8G1_9ZZZZ